MVCRNRKSYWVLGTTALFHLLSLVTLAGPAAALGSNLAQLAAAVLALLAAFAAARRSVSRVRRFWLLATFSFFVWSVAQALWIWQENVLGRPMPLLAVPHVLFFFSFIPMGIALLDDDAQSARIDWLVVLDSLQIVLAAVTTYFYLFHVPGLWPDREALAHTFANAIHVRNAVLVLAFLVRGSLAHHNERWLYLRWALFLTIYGSANVGGSFALVWLGLPSGTWFDLAWSVPFLLAALIAEDWYDASPEAASPASHAGVGRLLGLNLLPLTIPLLVLWMGSKIAMADLTLAAVTTSLAVGCYALRSLLLQLRQKRVAEKLHVSENRFRLFFAAHPQPMWVFDIQSLRFLEVNDAAVAKYGYPRSQFLQMRITDLKAPEDLGELEDMLRQELEKIPLMHTRHRLSSGEVIAVEIAARRLEFTGNQAMLVVATDVSERRRLEEQLRQAQKMEAVGALAGGVAHDFNNLLTVIKGYSSLLAESLRGDLVRLQEIEQIENAAERASGLTRQLLAFSRRQIFRLTPVNLNQSIQAITRMLERLLGENIRIEQRLAPDLGRIQGDPSQIDQVIMNLAVNARDAMPRGGLLTLETRNTSAAEFRGEEHSNVTPGDYVLLRVSDTGVGMDEATSRRIFEPFFTTKETGRGTGLGLSTVYGIVKQSGGHIWVESAPGEGTAFTILLPQSQAQPAAQEADGPAAKSARPAGHTILLVEDESSLRQFAEHVLARAGFRVLTAKSGEHALEVFTRHAAAVNLLLTDLVMPGINGHDLAELLREQQPSLNVVYMTGYAQEAVVLKDVSELSLNLIEKPFTPSALIRKIGEVMGYPRSALPCSQLE